MALIIYRYSEDYFKESNLLKALNFKYISQQTNIANLIIFYLTFIHLLLILISNTDNSDLNHVKYLEGEFI